MKKYRVWLFAVVSCLALAHAEAQDSGLWVNPNQFNAAPAELEEPAPLTPTEAGEKGRFTQLHRQSAVSSTTSWPAVDRVSR